jgi:hypothetical protein
MSFYVYGVMESETRIMPTQNLFEYEVFVDAKGLKHRVKLYQGRIHAGYELVPVCDVETWDMQDLREGSPTCVRGMCLS